MAKSNKPIFWSLFAAGGTLAAFLAPVLVLLFLLASLGHAPDLLSYAKLHAFAAHWFGKLFLLVVITLFLWHAAHRLRVTVYDFGLRQDSIAAFVFYIVAGAGTILSAVYLLRI
ncbi:MAG: fumarate reductase subunit D [Rhodoferax sp.]|uniref:fumarate reductase subunit FrdD n=1 Tax=Rhodoferax sp. TaxID=50421 RepID=UPI00261F485C|nr:fumarate reductase subunit FrdD [Rhodoferax sp.]MDD5335014.1 fumarate reductase subunit D [Rhodoferax sp.]